MMLPSVARTNRSNPDDAVSERLEAVLAKHRDFWRGKGLLVHTRFYVPVEGARVPLAGAGVTESNVYLEPEMLRPEDFVPKPADPSSSNSDLPDPREGDVLKIRGPFKIPWTEAIMGCPVKLVPASGASWAECFLDDLADAEQLRVAPGNAWLAKLVDFTRALVEGAEGRYFVTHATMRGPIDMADAMLGTEQLCLRLVDEPRRVRTLLDTCTESFILAAQAQWAVIPSTGGGHACRYGIWAPGEVTRTQADAASMLSPALYRREILPFDLQTLRAFPYGIMHVHSAYGHVAEPFLDADVPSALQVGYDQPPFGPGVRELLPWLRHLLKHKPLVFHGVVSHEEADMLCQELPPDGLLLDLFLV